MTFAALEQRQALGQFLMPPRIINFMASLFEHRPHKVKLLDPGAGIGASLGGTRSATLSSQRATSRNSHDSLRGGFLLDPGDRTNLRRLRIGVPGCVEIISPDDPQNLKQVTQKRILHVG
jgi:hypothetical protein